MDHVVYLDAVAKEFEKMQRGVKIYIIRGGSGPKFPYGKIFVGDVLYFINDNGEGAVKAKALVKSVVNSPKMTKEASMEFLEPFKEGLRFSATQEKRWEGKKYLMIVEIEAFERIESLVIDKTGYKVNDDWLPVGDIHNVLMI